MQIKAFSCTGQGTRVITLAPRNNGNKKLITIKD